jgi:hypothetical protein
MALIRVLTSIGVPSLATGGAGALGPSALRVLMVLPTWPLARWLGWSVAGVAAGAAIVGLFVFMVAWRQTSGGTR